MLKWLQNKENPATVAHAVRTAVAATVAYLAASFFRLPQTQWAPISALVVMQSDLAGSLPVSIQRLIGTAVGASVGALLDLHFEGSVIAFGGAVFGLGLVCAFLRADRAAYRYASITLAIVLFIPHTDTAWLAAFHRFAEVSIGVAVALAVSAQWPEYRSRQ
jgi:uncharacterized membrane protein YgaE (UPF0421/DUF939 family)